MKTDVRKVIAESIDTALSSFNYVDKEKFYHILEAKFELNPKDIPEKYEVFHNALARTFGLKHYAVERRIVEILHNRSKSGDYSEINEIPAFSVFVETFMAEVDQEVKKSRAQIKKSDAALSKIKKNKAY